MRELLILVDTDDNDIGLMDKLSVHTDGLLHRAFSIFIFNAAGELLMQQRADSKYHSGGLWSNTCCSHPNPAETFLKTLARRLTEEMGMQKPINFEFQFKFIYKIDFEDGLTEHEYDNVFFGKSDEKPKPNPAEVKAWKYMSMDNLIEDIAQNPQHYTEWLKVCLAEVVKHSELIKAS